MRIDSAYLEITNQCNLNCITCYNRSGLNRFRKELSMNQLTAVIERLSNEFGCREFSFAGGEPLLHSEFSSLISYMKAHMEFKFSFVTNGTVDRPDLIRLIQTEPERFLIQISLDGSCEAVNRLTRGSGSFAKSIGFLDQLAQSDLHPRVKMVISQKNMTDVEPFFHMVESHGGIPEYAFINCNGNATDDWETKSVSPRQKIQILKLLEKLNQQSDVSAFLPFSTNGCPLANPNKSLSVLIKVDGSIHPCQLLYDAAYSFGNILSDSASYLEDSIGRIRELAQERAACDYQCHRCLLRDACGKGCMAFAVYNTGDPLGEDGDCLTRKLEIADFELRHHINDPHL